MKRKKEDAELPGYPIYPSSEDVYSKNREERDIDPEDVSKHKTPNEEEGRRNEMNFKEDMTGEDLDIPGSEADEEQENAGSEDEENNFYSLGGDDHENLEEDNSGNPTEI
jgi:hypothetical protein